MSFFKAVGKFFEFLKQQRADVRTTRLLTDEPLNMETIARICKEFDYHWEFQQKDGTVLRFYKNGVATAPGMPEGDVW